MPVERCRTPTMGVARSGAARRCTGAPAPHPAAALGRGDTRQTTRDRTRARARGVAEREREAPPDTEAQRKRKAWLATGRTTAPPAPRGAGVGPMPRVPDEGAALLVARPSVSHRGARVTASSAAQCTRGGAPPGIRASAQRARRAPSQN